MPRSYYICPIDLAQGSAHLFVDSHWIDVGNGMALISARFQKDSGQDAWEEHVTVNPLPSLFDPSSIDPQTLSLLAPIGAKPGHSTKDIRKLARVIHKLM